MRRGLMVDLAEALGVDPSALSQWQEVPAERVPAVARFLGVERYQLRPDLWDPPCRKR